MLWGHVGREVLIKLDPADWGRCRRNKLYQVVIMLDTTTNIGIFTQKLLRELDGEVSPVNYYQSDDQLGYSNYIEIDY